jgi:hypothetical protein
MGMGIGIVIVIERYGGQLNEGVNNDGMNEWENELSPNYMYACFQLDTCHVERYFGPLVPILRN